MKTKSIPWSADISVRYISPQVLSSPSSATSTARAAVVPSAAVKSTAGRLRSPAACAAWSADEPLPPATERPKPSASRIANGRPESGVRGQRMDISTPVMWRRGADELRHRPALRPPLDTDRRRRGRIPALRRLAHVGLVPHGDAVAAEPALIGLDREAV